MRISKLNAWPASKLFKLENGLAFIQDWREKVPDLF
jgi:hypothetical protein